ALVDPPVMADMGQAGGGYEADVAGADHGDAHADEILGPETLELTLADSRGTRAIRNRSDVLVWLVAWCDTASPCAGSSCCWSLCSSPRVPGLWTTRRTQFRGRLRSPSGGPEPAGWRCGVSRLRRHRPGRERCGPGTRSWSTRRPGRCCG